VVEKLCHPFRVGGGIILFFYKSYHPFGILDFWVEPHLSRRINFGKVIKTYHPFGILDFKNIGIEEHHLILFILKSCES
jgi:hypothetical protein